jgi:perosamine synthetase
MIEDNAQAPFAMEEGRFTGTIGHIGVFSLNVHKHIQCGEGGVIVTDDDEMAYNLQGAINHGELAFPPRIGLNLRMTEPIAAIACAQLAKAPKIIEGRRDIGLALCDMVKDIPWLHAHTDRPNCKHVYYLWTALADTEKRAISLAGRMQIHGAPFRCSYAPLLHKLFKSGDKCPVVEDVDSRIIVFEVCAWDLTAENMTTIREIVKRVTGEVDERAA